MDRVDETADARPHERAGESREAVGVVRGVRAIIKSMLHQPSRHAAPAGASGRT